MFFLYMVCSVLTSTFLKVNNALAKATYFSSDNFLTGIHLSICSPHKDIWSPKLCLCYIELEYLLFPLYALFQSDPGEKDFQYDLLHCFVIFSVPLDPP